MTNLEFCSLIRNFAPMKQVRPKKNLGQHFLTDLNIAKRIADTVDACPDIPVLEVGPRESVAYLQENFPRLNDNIIGGDFLRMDLHEVFDGQQFVLTGNYPYDISSQIFFKMLDNKDLIPCCTGMIQHEVAVRMASQPGNKHRTHGIAARQQAIRHTICIDTGVVQRRVSVYCRTRCVQSATKGAERSNQNDA